MDQVFFDLPSPNAIEPLLLQASEPLGKNERIVMDFDDVASAAIDSMAGHLRQVGAAMVGRLTDDAADSLYRLVADRLARTVPGRQRLGDLERAPTDGNHLRAVSALLAEEAKRDAEFGRILHEAIRRAMVAGTTPPSVTVVQSGTHVRGNQIAGRDISNVDKTKRYEIKIGTLRLRFGLGSLLSGIATLLLLLGGGAVVAIPFIVPPADTPEAIAQGFADRLDRSSKLTFTAQYRGDHGIFTWINQPPNFADISVSYPGNSLLITADHVTGCNVVNRQIECNRASSSSGRDQILVNVKYQAPFDAYLTFTIRRRLVRLATVPGAKVETTKRPVAGESSDCIRITNIDDSDNLAGFTLCVNDLGILTYWWANNFSNSALDFTGKEGGIELISYRQSADPNVFKPPSAAHITDIA